jgi:hypothetical protein
VVSPGTDPKKVVDVRPVDPDGDVESIEEGCRQPAGVTLASGIGAFAHARRPALAARARVHGSDQDEPGRVGGGAPGPADPDLAVLQRLAEGVEHHPRELTQFVQKQYAPVGWGLAMLRECFERVR